MLRVIVLDDDDKRAENDWAKGIRSATRTVESVEVVALSSFNVAQTVSSLQTSSWAAREGNRSNNPSSHAEDLAIDGSDVTLIDYDLTPTPNRQGYGNVENEKIVRSKLSAETSETIAYLARCYSKCRYIVSVNQAFKNRTFDLTFQRFVDSRADLNISQDEIGSVELWTGVGDGYHPWSWPVLASAGDLFERRVGLVDLNSVVLESLGLLPLGRSGLDARQLDLLGDEPETATFRDVATSPELGLVGRDQQNNEDALKRIAAAGVGRWLDRVVMPAQNVLVDAPHLAYRFPSLITGNPETVESWNATAALGGAVGINESKLAQHRTSASEWFDRPIWLWSTLVDDQSIAEVASPWSSKSYNFVFCEDISKFALVTESREVQTDLPGSYSRRFIRRVENAIYRPTRRLTE